jgi:hypothetical protein
MYFGQALALQALVRVVADRVLLGFLAQGDPEVVLRERRVHERLVVPL